MLRLNSSLGNGMSRQKTQCEALSVGQLARKWGVAIRRIHKLINKKKIPGVFEIPATDGYKATVRIPVKSVQLVQRTWLITQDEETHPHRRRRLPPDQRLLKKHLPELLLPEHDSESHEDVPESN